MSLPPVRVLVVDDTLVNRKILQACLGQIKLPGLTLEVDSVENGQEAVDLHAVRRHDLILMDVMMPVMGGLDAARLIRDVDQETTIIFVSASSDEDMILNSFDFGIGFISKPIRPAVMTKNIAAHVQSIMTRKEAARLTDEHRAELALAGSIIEQLQQRVSAGTGVETYVHSLQDSSGDTVMHLNTTSGKTYVLHADCVGHGLPAALTMIPAIPVFEAMAKKGFDVAQIAIEMNRTLRRLMPVGRFIAAALIQLDHHTGRGAIANCGLPPAVIASPERFELLKSKNLPLGMVSPADFEVETEDFNLYPGERLWAMSDGLTELLDEETLIICMSGGTLRSLQAALLASEVLARQHDDISISTIEWRPDVVNVPTTSHGQASCNPTTCPLCPLLPIHLSIRLTAQDLKKASTMEQLLATIQGAGLAQYVQGAVATVLVELYTNALDHGLLGLTSESKYSGRFTEYLQARELALEELTDGVIQVDAWTETVNGVRKLHIKVHDSGLGYEVDEPAVIEQEDTALAGRGLPLIRQLAEQVLVTNQGTCTEVVLVDTPTP